MMRLFCPPRGSGLCHTVAKTRNKHNHAGSETCLQDRVGHLSSRDGNPAEGSAQEIGVAVPHDDEQFGISVQFIDFFEASGDVIGWESAVRFSRPTSRATFGV